MTPSQRLDQVVGAAPPGTTFWLTSGVHRLDRGRFARSGPRTDRPFIGAPGAVIDGQHAQPVRLHRARHGRDDRAPDDPELREAGAATTTRASSTTTPGTTGGCSTTRSAATPAQVSSWAAATSSRATACWTTGSTGSAPTRPTAWSGVVLRHNEIAGNNTDDWEHRQPGCGCTGGGKFWETRDARVIDNWIHDNHSVGLWADTNNTGFLVQGNYISDNAAKASSTRPATTPRSSTTRSSATACVDGPGEPGLPHAGAVHLGVRQRPEGGTELRRHVRGGPQQVRRQLGRDRWRWENADRFAGSPANTSTGIHHAGQPGGRDRSPRCSDPDKVEREALRRRLPVEDPAPACARQHVPVRPGTHRRRLHPGERMRLHGPLLQLRHLARLVAVQGRRSWRTTSRSTRTTGGTPTGTSAPGASRSTSWAARCRGASGARRPTTRTSPARWTDAGRRLSRTPTAARPSAKRACPAGPAGPATAPTG